MGYNADMQATLTNDANWLAEIGFDDNGWLTKEVNSTCQAGGCYRSVWLFDDWVIKFARQNPDNRHEWDVYRDMPKEVRELMAAPLAISDDSRVLIMERMGKTLAQETHDFDTRERLACEFNKTLREALTTYAGFSPYECDIITGDNHNNNIAFDKTGNLRWIDYGVNL